MGSEMVSGAEAPASGRMYAALALFRRLRNESPGASAHRLALQAVDAVYCTLIDVDADSATCRLTPSREEDLVVSLLRRAGVSQSESTPQQPASDSLQDRVQRASEQSFPSSDPPGWIWGAPDPPARH